MGVSHYENFPVASILLPKPLRRPVTAIYRFARAADDIADEGFDEPAVRLARLNDFSAELDRIANGEATRHPIFLELRSAIKAYDLPIGLFADLLDAFKQDVTQGRYDTYAQLLDYCKRSANPIGRLLLHLYGYTSSAHMVQSDAICTSLQLINFLQDVRDDFARGRIYLPQEDLRTFGVTEQQIARHDQSGGWQALMGFEIRRARELMDSGKPLGTALPGRIGLELRMIIAGGTRILEKLVSIGGDVFHRRPVLRPFDWVLMLTRAMASTAVSR